MSVTFYHPKLKQGAICHGRKPTRGCQYTSSGLKICRELGDYVSCSLEFMMAYFNQQGVLRQEMEIKLFGGAMMFNNLTSIGDGTVMTLGKRNIDTAMDFIRRQRLHLTSSDVGGPWARQIIFNTETGDIKLKRIRSTLQELENMESV
ncbi:MAG: chemotaxis protein CheD [Magnetococcus sp. YQC-5]